ncbi:hypothetical protein [Acanthamoeba castellanii mimivirus]|uniref:Uncharacterized protein L180 n=5 Tax=Mimivirus TaxID=315393 RepID=YL180_MIMIV|nr:hypothetical protein MIMI_gp0200 [Acanthamoeba polyphaga mimivirus]Q5UPN5.1 RecName: Full=Uncharacterized protein L180 [Acanthamoeba polyphaga mimivirus]ALR83691.1 hypothetical protein [Niemeyer virus]AMK61791.1 hypothetical protein [Samba virus]AMZ02628.1 hypothetical protein [Mimivirus Bombay]QTF49084.1 hypothetical protein [Mimivirus reunion]WMV61527.1 hypothetical protein qu_189 [Mimivirus sp.]BAV61268.1 hypothetical protein [Acanthamoeba castellanii mimivirus]
MSDFIFCYGSQNKKRLSKYIKQTKNNHKLYLSDDNYIHIKIETRIGRKYIVVDFNDSLDFINFIVRKKIYCNSKNKHNCDPLKLHSDYLNYIVQHKHYDIIKIFYKKFIPLIKSRQNLESLRFAFQNRDNLEVIKYIFKCGSLEDTKELIIDAFIKIPNITMEFMDDIISIYKHKFTKVFMTNGLYTPVTLKIDLDYFLKPAFRTDDVNLFDIIVEELSTLTDEIDKTKLDKKQLEYLKFFDTTLNAGDINSILYHDLIYNINNPKDKSHNYYCPNIFRRMIFSLDNINLLRDNVFDILTLDLIEYANILCDFIGNNDPGFIEMMFIYAKSTEMAQLLIDSGVDYEALYKSNKLYRSEPVVKKLVNRLIKENANS